MKDEILYKRPPKNAIFVFGSNREGRHGAGAAYAAIKHFGAVYGQAEGIQGQSYGIVTKELRSNQTPVSLEEVKEGVDRFIDFARENPDLDFIVTRIGCGLAGFTDDQIAPMFAGAPENCTFPYKWIPILSKTT